MADFLHLQGKLEPSTLRLFCTLLTEHTESDSECTNMNNLPLLEKGTCMGDCVGQAIKYYVAHVLKYLGPNFVPKNSA